jgi:flagellar basal-body rod protein FlgB
MVNKLSEFMFNKLGVPKVQKYLDLASFRHKLIGGNIANVSTPGYKSRDIDFQSEFKKATSNTSRLAGEITHQSHIPLGQHSARPPEIEKAAIGDGDMNSVDIDTQVSNMTQNQLRYTVAARLLQKKFESTRNAITSR